MRIQLDEMPSFSGVPRGLPTLLYGLRFVSRGIHYEVRVQRTPAGALTRGGASCGLFRCDTPLLCTQVSSLRGGYGTTGEEVVVSVPLSGVGLEGGGELGEVEAFTARGTFLSGAFSVLDTVSVVPPR